MTHLCLSTTDFSAPLCHIILGKNKNSYNMMEIRIFRSEQKKFERHIFDCFQHRNNKQLQQNGLITSQKEMAEGYLRSPRLSEICWISSWRAFKDALSWFKRSWTVSRSSWKPLQLGIRMALHYWVDIIFLQRQFLTEYEFLRTDILKHDVRILTVRFTGQVRLTSKKTSL